LVLLVLVEAEYAVAEQKQSMAYLGKDRHCYNSVHDQEKMDIMILLAVGV
jgi:hypothetical protein